MQCIGSPRWGEGRCESEAVGPALSDILGGGSQFGAQEGPEELKVGSSSVQSALADVPAVFSLLAEDGAEEVSEEVHPHSDFGGDSPAEFGGGCDHSQEAAAVLRELNAVGGVQFQFSDLPAVESLLAGIEDRPEGACMWVEVESVPAGSGSSEEDDGDGNGGSASVALS